MERLAAPSSAFLCHLGKSLGPPRFVAMLGISWPDDSRPSSHQGAHAGGSRASLNFPEPIGLSVRPGPPCETEMTTATK